MAGTAGMLPERETPIDSNAPTIAELTAQMFAEPIATGEVVVTDPESAPAVTPITPPAGVAAPSAAPTTPAASAPTPAAIEAQPEPELVAEPETPTFRSRWDDDARALLEEPDFEEEARVEVAAELEDGDGEYEYTDPQVAARIRALEKRNAFLESQNIAKSKKGWVEEAKRGCPDLARWLPGRIEGIDASSRRAFLREAERRNLEAQQIFGPTLAKLEADRAAIAADAVAAARAEVAAAWGRPAADTLPPTAAAAAEALAKARAKGDLEGAIKALMQDNPVL